MLVNEGFIAIKQLDKDKEEENPHITVGKVNLKIIEKATEHALARRTRKVLMFCLVWNGNRIHPGTCLSFPLFFSFELSILFDLEGIRNRRTPERSCWGREKRQSDVFPRHLSQFELHEYELLEKPLRCCLFIQNFCSAAARFTRHFLCAWFELKFFSCASEAF